MSTVGVGRRTLDQAKAPSRHPLPQVLPALSVSLRQPPSPGRQPSPELLQPIHSPGRTGVGPPRTWATHDRGCWESSTGGAISYIMHWRRKWQTTPGFLPGAARPIWTAECWRVQICPRRDSLCSTQPRALSCGDVDPVWPGVLFLQSKPESFACGSLDLHTLEKNSDFQIGRAHV